jgi:hypothetical protein
MEETPPMPPPVAQQAPPAPTSLPARLLNVFASPGEVFEEVKRSPTRTGNWLVPALLAAIVGVITVWILFSQPAFMQRMREQWASGYEGMVKQGKMSQAQADGAVATIEKFAAPIGSVSAVAISFVNVFWWALILWLLGKIFLKAKFSFMKAVETAGLATMIGVLGGIVALLLSVNFGKLSGANLDLLLGSSDPKSKLHPLFAVLDIFKIWSVGVMAVGLARLAEVRFMRALLPVAGYWIAWNFFWLSMGMLVQSLMGAK